MKRRKRKSAGQQSHSVQPDQAPGSPTTASGVNTPARLPAEFLERLSDIFPADCLAAVLQSLELPRALGVRVNRIRGSTGELLAWAAEHSVELQQLAGLEEGWLAQASDRERLSHSPLVADGKIYLQSPISQYVARLLDPQPGETVLDLAAAPGGKTSHLADLMCNEGQLSAVEAVRSRFFRLQANLQKLGVTNCRTFLMDGRAVPRKTGPRFDRVLLDAPCSGEARMRVTDPESLGYWSLRKLRECSRKQVGLIEAAFGALRPGGVLLYCTCSFAPEENERVVSRLLDRQAGKATILPLLELPFATLPGMLSFRDEEFSPGVEFARRIIPGPEREGFFVALIRKGRPEDGLEAGGDKGWTGGSAEPQAPVSIDSFSFLGEPEA